MSDVVVVFPCVPAMTTERDAPEEVIADRFGQRAIPDLAIEDLFELRVASRDGVADDDEIELGADVIGAVALERGDALLNEKVAHRRIHVLVRAANVVIPCS